MMFKREVEAWSLNIDTNWYTVDQHNGSKLMMPRTTERLLSTDYSTPLYPFQSFGEWMETQERPRRLNPYGPPKPSHILAIEEAIRLGNLDMALEKREARAEFRRTRFFRYAAIVYPDRDRRSYIYGDFPKGYRTMRKLVAAAMEQHGFEVSMTDDFILIAPDQTTADLIGLTLPNVEVRVRGARA